MNINSPIRVLQVFGAMNRGGAESMIMNLFRNVDCNKVVFDFVVHTSGHCQYDDEIEQLGGKIYHCPKFKVYNFFKYKKWWKKFFLHHKEYKIIHGHMGSTASIYLYIAKNNGLFTIAHSHSASLKYSLHDILYRILNYPARFISDQLFGCSSAAGIARYGKKSVKKRKYSNFFNAINIYDYKYNESYRNEIRTELNIDRDAIVIGTVGRITSAKNPFFIIKIFERIVKSNKNTVCVWVGTGELFEKIKHKISKRNLANKVIMTGVRDDVNKLLSSMDCFLFPSLWEGLPVSVVEAQSSGLPCVISTEITNEVAVTDLVTFISLKKNPQFWAEICLKKALENKRCFPYERIKKGGYDIIESSKELASFYLKNM